MLEAVALLSQVLLLGVVIVLWRSRAVSAILSTAILFYAGMWHIIPVTIGVLWGRGAYASTLTDSTGFLAFAIIETLLLILSLLFLLRPRPRFSAITDSLLAQYRPGPVASFVILALGICLMYVTTNRLSGFFAASYLDRNAFIVDAQGGSEFNELGMVGFVLSMLLSFAYACLVHKWPAVSGAILVKITAAIWVAVFTFQELIQGGRISMFLPLMLLVMYGRMMNWTKRRFITVLSIALIAMIPVASIFSVVIADIRGSTQLRWNDVLSNSLGLVESSQNADNIGDAVVNQLIVKFDSFSTSAFLVETVGRGTARLRPYLGAVLSIVPRAIMPSKPVSGSIDETYLGHPSRLVPLLSGDSSGYASVGVSPATISFWHLGYLGLAIFVLFNVLNLYFINSLLLSASVVSKTLGLFLIGLPPLTILVASPDVLIMNWERTLIIYLVLTLGVYLISKDRRHGRFRLGVDETPPHSSIDARSSQKSILRSSRDS